jgi:Predicted nucleoside-diphosphate sugar epimerases
MPARQRQVLASAVFVLDGALLALAWLGAYWLRFHALGLPAPLGVPPLDTYLWFGAVLTPCALLVLRSFHIYRSARTARLAQETGALLKGMALVGALAAVGSYFTKGELSRFTLLIFTVLAAALLVASRLAIRTALRAVRRRGRNLRGTLIVGTGELAALLLAKIREHRDFGLDVRGLVAAAPCPAGRRWRACRCWARWPTCRRWSSAPGPRSSTWRWRAPSTRPSTRRSRGWPTRPPRCGWCPTWPAPSR